MGCSMMIGEGSRLFGNFDDQVPTPALRDPVEVWAHRIGERWQQTLEAIFDVAGMLVHAKIDLGRGNWERMCNTRLPFKIDTARKLLKIANDERLRNPDTCPLLPPYWRI